MGSGHCIAEHHGRVRAATPETAELTHSINQSNTLREDDASYMRACVQIPYGYSPVMAVGEARQAELAPALCKFMAAAARGWEAFVQAPEACAREVPDTPAPDPMSPLEAHMPFTHVPKTLELLTEFDVFCVNAFVLFVFPSVQAASVPQTPLSTQSAFDHRRLFILPDRRDSVSGDE